MPLNIRHDEQHQQFTALLDQAEIGELAYALPDSETIDFQHTFIEKEHRGQGHANTLIKFGLDYASEQGLQVKATCRAVASYLERYPQ
ncbi:GNAT family N-acetyltransferase [Rufibacter roseus]|uniref:GNAT family N-acetyltransferase n=1 Tax=Rufibacter roseus TaxID=1567108 RepID=A0ABW2DM09_9BACT|nr:GNAT family N-acetyltransferase [Rufibacter roseus]